MNKLSIIIPVLNEETFIGKLLEHLLNNVSHKHNFEIIVVDGGSIDETITIVSTYKDTYPNIKFLHAPKGRAKQLNFGAKHATGNIFYFLHADAFPPKNFDELIVNEIENGNLAGCFRMQFKSKHWWLCLASWLTQFRWRACRGGDQSQFILKDLFNDIGGYDENYIIYEDNILINELYARNEFVVINKTILTSARLYEKVGIWKLQYHFWTIYVKRWFGASAEELYDYYKKRIS